MTIEQIEKELILLEDICIHNTEDHYIEYLMIDYTEGGYECCIDKSDRTWFIDESIQKLNNLFFQVEESVEDEKEYSALVKRIVHCKYELDKIVVNEELKIPYYEVEETLSSQSIICSNEETKKNIQSLHSVLIKHSLIKESFESFLKTLDGSRAEKIQWNGAKNKLSVFSKLLKPNLKDDYSDKWFEAIALKFKCNGKPVSNTQLSKSYSTIKAEAEEEFAKLFS